MKIGKDSLSKDKLRVKEDDSSFWEFYREIQEAKKQQKMEEPTKVDTDKKIDKEPPVPGEVVEAKPDRGILGKVIEIEEEEGEKRLRLLDELEELTKRILPLDCRVRIYSLIESVCTRIHRILFWRVLSCRTCGRKRVHRLVVCTSEVYGLECDVCGGANVSWIHCWVPFKIKYYSYTPERWQRWLQHWNAMNEVFIGKLVYTARGRNVILVSC